MIEMKVKTIALDADTKNPVMILTDLEEKRFLPIWIGSAEAQAILSEMEGIAQSRPMTHDLMKQIVEHHGGKVRRIVVNDLQEQTYFARIVFEANGKESELDARPSDSVALALRFKAPVYVTEQVIQKAAIPDKSKLAEENRKFKEFVEHLSAEMFTAGGDRPPAAGVKGDPPADSRPGPEPHARGDAGDGEA